MLLMKMGDKGILTSTDYEASTLDSYFVMDSFVSRLVDAVGAGDALLAYTTLAMISTKDPTLSSILGNLAAACECEKAGNIPVSPEDIILKIDEIENAINYGHLPD